MLRRFGRDTALRVPCCGHQRTGPRATRRQPYLSMPPTFPLPRPAKRLSDYLRLMRLMLGETRNQVHATRAELEGQLSRLGAQLAQLDTLATRQTDGVSQLVSHVAQLEAQGERAAAARTSQHEQLVQILRFVHDRGQWHRERLRELRDDPAYEPPYSKPAPLVSVVIPTYDNYQLLRERAIPSVLAQTHQNFEIVVVGDGAPDGARTAVEGFNDPRITFFNLGYRGPYPVDAKTRWLVAGVPPYNEAVRRAKGLWIAPLDDDDAFHPDHLERLLNLARAERLELTYGRLTCHLADGAVTTLGRFPPEHGQFGVQSSLYHSGLARIFELELADAALGLPYDWAVCLRMMEAGVRIGMLDEVTVDYYPSESWTPRSGSDGPEPTVPPPSTDAPSRPEWEYVPEGWDRSRRPGEASALGWNAGDVARAYRDKWPQFLAAVEGPWPLGVGHEVPIGEPLGRHDAVAQSAILAYAYALARAAGGSEQLSVLDWGGALGHYQVLGRRLLPAVFLDYHCRELPAVCAAGRTVLPDATFHDSDDCLERRYDLVVASSSLQYEEDWQALLRRLAHASRGWMFLTRVPLAQHGGSFVVLQRANAYGYATEYLGWVLDRDELLDAALDAGLELEREFVLAPGWLIPGAPDEVSHAGFLFRVTRPA